MGDGDRVSVNSSRGEGDDPHPNPPPEYREREQQTSGLRLLHVTDTFLPKIGGAEIAIDSLVRTMDRLGAKCEVLRSGARGWGRRLRCPIRCIGLRHRDRRCGRDGGSGGISSGWKKTAARLMRISGTMRFRPAMPSRGRRASGGRRLCMCGVGIFITDRDSQKSAGVAAIDLGAADAAAIVCLSAAMEELVKEIVGPSHAAARGSDCADSQWH